MAAVLIIGASRGVGLEAVKAAVAAGHHVRAFSRSAEHIALSAPNLEKQNGDALAADAIERALDGIDSVVQTLGVRVSELFRPVTLFSQATRVLVPIMERRGVNRLIALTGYGTGDSQQALNVLEAVPFKLLFGRAYADKGIQEDLIKQSTLDWTIVRPGMLISGPSWGRCKVLREASSWRNGIIPRVDVAAFMISQLTDRRYIRQAPVLSSI